jgi:hypothetical protein
MQTEYIIDYQHNRLHIRYDDKAKNVQISVAKPDNHSRKCATMIDASGLKQTDQQSITDLVLDWPDLSAFCLRCADIFVHIPDE